MSLLHKIENQKINNDQLIRLMTPMIAGILACVFCLVSMTWAWFTASVNTPVQTIQAATQFTKVKVYEVVKTEEGNDSAVRTLVKPTEESRMALKEVSLIDELQTDKDISVVMAEEPLVWELSPEKSYEIVMTSGGTASQGYCKVALSHTESGKDTPETKLYHTSAFEKDTNVTFTYNTGGFPKEEGVTETQWKEYVEKTTSPTLTIASYWGEPTDETSQVSLMSLRDTAGEVMLLSDGDVLGLDPIPCPEAKAETEVELEGFETEEGAVISAEEDYKISLTLKDGYEMPSEVVVNIDGKDYVVSTGGAQANEETPYYDAQSGVLTVPSTLLSDGAMVSVKASATQVPAEEPEEEKTEEETAEETTDNDETEEGKSTNTSSGNNVIADSPTKKEDGEQDGGEPEKTPAGGGGNGDGDDESGDSSNGDNSSYDDSEDEKADVTLNLSQLTINLEETKIPTNADLVLTLSAKEDMKFPEQIVITLDKTIRDENVEEEEIEEDKTEYIINTDGKNNPEHFEFDKESGELIISSELLEGVREITIADSEQNETNKDDEKVAITFEVKNITFDFTDDEIVTDEDVVINFTAGEGYVLPETIVITIDGEEYIIYTGEEDGDKNPEGITFDAETGTLTISKDLLEDVKAITITAEGVEEEDENPEDKDTEGKENGVEGGEVADKEPENGTDAPTTEDKTETEGETEVEGGANNETTTPETNPDNTTEGEDSGENDGENNGGDEGETEPVEPGTEPMNPTTPGEEDNIDTEQGGENIKTEENDEGTTENEAGETTEPIPDTEKSDGEETPAEPSTPDTEVTTPVEPSATPTEPTISAPDTSEMGTPSDSTQASADASATPDTVPVLNTNNNSNGESQSSDETTSESKETSFEE